MSVLLTEQDFYDLAMAYFRKVHSQNVVYAEVFFDPQAHTSRGIPFRRFMDGFHRAQQDAEASLGLRSLLIMQLARNAFTISWIAEDDKDRYLAALEAYAT